MPPEANAGSGELRVFCGLRPPVWSTKSLPLLSVSWPLPANCSAPPVPSVAAVDPALALRSMLAEAVGLGAAAPPSGAFARPQPTRSISTADAFRMRTWPSSEMPVEPQARSAVTEPV